MRGVFVLVAACSGASTNVAEPEFPPAQPVRCEVLRLRQEIAASLRSQLPDVFRTNRVAALSLVKSVFTTNDSFGKEARDRLEEYLRLDREAARSGSSRPAIRLGEALADLELQRGSSGVRGVVCSAGRKSTQTGDADSTFTGSLRWFTRKREVGANCVDEVTYGRSAPTRYERLIIEPQGIAGTFEIAGCTYFGQSVAATTSVTRDGKRVDITSEVKALCFSKSFQAETEVRELAEPTNLMIDGVALDEYEVAHELFADCETGN